MVGGREGLRKREREGGRVNASDAWREGRDSALQSLSDLPVTIAPPRRERGKERGRENLPSD